MPLRGISVNFGICRWTVILRGPVRWIPAAPRAPWGLLRWIRVNPGRHPWDTLETPLRHPRVPRWKWPRVRWNSQKCDESPKSAMKPQKCGERPKSAVICRWKSQKCGGSPKSAVKFWKNHFHRGSFRIQPMNLKNPGKNCEFPISTRAHTGFPCAHACGIVVCERAHRIFCVSTGFLMFTRARAWVFWCLHGRAQAFREVGKMWKTWKNPGKSLDFWKNQ